MLLQSRQKRKARKQVKSMQNQSGLENPQIKELVGRVNQLAADSDSHIRNPLNMIRWRKVKYHPSEAEVRMHVENEISLSKVLYEKVRARNKPIKNPHRTNFYSGDKVPYRQKYEEFKDSQSASGRCHQQEEQSENGKLQQSQASGIKFYDKIKKYSRVLEYVTDRNEERNRPKTGSPHKTFYSMELRKNSSNNFSPRKTQQVRAHTQTVIRFENQQVNTRVDNIMQKWKPVGRSCKSVLKKAKSEANRCVSFHVTPSQREQMGDIRMTSTFYGY